ncbi:MAG TPA: hypothetical protein VGR73_03535 [Bryobacteraceae bacterium]|nr:hypothetical protein [Bryobacteraceae bacterium]
MTANPVPIGKLTFDLQTGCHAFAFSFEGRPVPHEIDTFPTLELAKLWADPWDGRIWEEPSDADDSALLVSRSKKPRALR